MNQRNPLSYLLVLLVVVALPSGLFAQPVELEDGNPADHVASAKDNEQARGDLDRDGDIDLVVARKQDWATKAPHLLYLNMHGVLTDRTNDFGAGSVDSGDPGFDTPTSGRLVRVADMNNDGWLDVISSTAPDSGQPAGIGYPWVYMNQCCSVGGCDATSCSTENWLGLRFENDRIPEMLTGGKERK